MAAATRRRAISTLGNISLVRRRSCQAPLLGRIAAAARALCRKGAATGAAAASSCWKLSPS